MRRSGQRALVGRILALPVASRRPSTARASANGLGPRTSGRPTPRPASTASAPSGRILPSHPTPPPPPPQRSGSGPGPTWCGLHRRRPGPPAPLRCRRHARTRAGRTGAPTGGGAMAVGGPGRAVGGVRHGGSAVSYSNVVFNVKVGKWLFFYAAKEPFRLKKRAEGPLFFSVRYRLNENSAATCTQIVVRFTGPRSGINNWPGRCGLNPSNRTLEGLLCGFLPKHSIQWH